MQQNHIYLDYLTHNTVLMLLSSNYSLEQRLRHSGKDLSKV